MDGEHSDTQWTSGARLAYRKRTEELIAALQAHMSHNLDRAGRQAELQPYFESAETLWQATKAFNDAEFDWCGSIPLALLDDDGDWDDEDNEDEGQDDDETEGGTVLTIVGRWDFLLADTDAFIAEGRSAYLKGWPDDTEEDAEHRIENAEDAAAQLMHRSELPGLEGAAGLQPIRSVTSFLVHDGDDDETFDEDPFAIARD